MNWTSSRAVWITPLVAIGAGLLLAAIPSPAAAVHVRVTSYFDLIDMTASQNQVVVSSAGVNSVRISDAAGVTFDPFNPSAQCTAESPQAAVCDLGAGFIGPSIFELNEGDDSLLLLLDWFTAVDASGGAGNDTITGMGERDKLRGGPGNDVLSGNGGMDELSGALGDDVCLGGAGRDHCDGGAGDDRCEAGEGADSCHGTNGRDVCVMGAGEDNCFGGKGRDRCDGGPGNDYARDCERTRRFEERSFANKR